MLCCGKCFSDTFIEEQINALSHSIGACSFCHQKGVQVVPPSAVADFFQSIIDLYEENVSGGQPISALIKADWGFFEALQIDAVDSILDAMFPSLDVHLRRVNPITPAANYLERWDKFSAELKHQNRFFSSEFVDDDALRSLIGMLRVELGTSDGPLYRARLNKEGVGIPAVHMGKPPKEKATGGRANPVGISYLYVASDPTTAVSELRPHRGEEVTVAQIKIIAPLTLVDLRNPRKIISPFKVEEDSLLSLYAGIEYLCKLGDELSKPIVPRRADLDYLPSQYLCEYIKHLGMGGVIYKSSLGTGYNMALFDGDSSIEIADTMSTSVEAITVRHSVVAFAQP